MLRRVKNQDIFFRLEKPTFVKRTQIIKYVILIIVSFISLIFLNIFLQEFIRVNALYTGGFIKGQ